MRSLKRVFTIVLIGIMFGFYIGAVTAATGKVNINTDGKQVLVTLKYVGDKIADRIIEYRKSHRFEVPADIMNVKGIGQKVYEANKDRIVVKD